MSVAAAIGTFDGMHRGHQALLQHLVGEARRRGMSTRVITFDRHPLSVVAPAACPPLIDDDATRIGRVSDFPGIDAVQVLSFDSRTAAMTARDFLQHMAASGIGLLLMGHDSRFGSDMPRDIETYARIAEEFGIEVIEGDVLLDTDGRPVSSSAIRSALRDGDVDSATRMLGRHFALKGSVVSGRRQGRTIGFPTANVAVDDSLIMPAPGVYAAIASADTFPEPLPAMVNIGCCPTFTDGSRQTVEAHIIGWDGDLYGKTMQLEFVEHLRDERRFSSADALVHQLDIDRSNVLSILKENIYHSQAQ